MIKHIVLGLMVITLAMTGMNAAGTCPGGDDEVDGSGIGRASLSKKDREGKTGVDNYKYFLDTEGEFVGDNDDEFEYSEGKAKVSFADGQLSSPASFRRPLAWPGFCLDGSARDDKPKEVRLVQKIRR